MALTPWPNLPTNDSADSTKRAYGDKVNLLTAALGVERPDDDNALKRLHATAAAVSARVEQYAGSAPAGAKDEALIRGVAWLQQTEGADRVSAVGGGGLNIDPTPVNSGGWFAHSGARSLLAPWRARRGGLVQEVE